MSTTNKRPSDGENISMSGEKLIVPNKPIIPFIEGDGIGPDVWRASKRVIDAAIEKNYRGKKEIKWLEVYAGEKANQLTGNWLPDETIEACNEFLVAIKGPLTTPIGGGIRSLNVALRQILDLYVCLRPVRWFKGVPSPVKQPELIDMVIFRENTEDIYAGIEFEQGSENNKKFLATFKDTFPNHYKKIRFPETSGIGIKPISSEGTQRLVRAAIDYAIKNNQKSVTFVHKGNIMKYTEGAFRNWGYELAEKEFKNKTYSWDRWERTREKKGVEAAESEMAQSKKEGKVLIKDSIADITLQQVLTRPEEFDVIATMNLNGDYLSDALAAMVGGIGIAPGANVGDEAAMFEATHGTAPKYAGLDKVNPLSLILSAEMMLRHINWNEAADLLINSIEKTIQDRYVTYDFERLMDNASLVSCSGFAKEMIKRM